MPTASFGGGGGNFTRIAPAAAGQLGAGLRAGPGLVGYLGSPGALTVLNPGDTLPGGWSANWDDEALIIGGNNLTVNLYRINGEIVFTGSNPTMTNCDVRSQVGALYGVTHSGSGVFSVSDTTVLGAASGPAQQNAISSDSGLRAVRCDVSRSGDGIHMVAQASAADAVISQCYVHDQAFRDEDQHCDGIQGFTLQSTQTFFKVEHTYVARTTSTIGTPMNAAVTCGPPTNDASYQLCTTVYNNNYFEAGLYHLQLGFRMQNAVITNNDLGPVHAQEYDYVSVYDPPSLVTWSNNRDENGSLLSQPT